LIPTRHKFPVSTGTSYPLGAAAISNALAHVPHFGDLGLSFYNQSVDSRAEFERLLTARKPYTIFRAEYRPERKPPFAAHSGMVAHGHYETEWSLTVYPVLSSFRQMARQLLLAEALPATAAWLQESSSRSWLAVPQGLAFEFDPQSAAMTSRRTAGV